MMKEKDTYNVVIDNATGMLEATRYNCDLTGYCLSREHANEAFRDPRFKSKGFYILIARELDALRVYIGDTTQIKGRFLTHCNPKSQKFDWKKALIFLNNRDHGWNGDETYDLQGIVLNRLRERGFEAKDNVQHPQQRTSQGVHGALEETANHVDGFFHVLGFPELAQAVKDKGSSAAGNEGGTGSASKVKVFQGHTIWGDARLSWDGSNGFTVLAGSKIRTTENARSLGQSGVRNREANAKHYMPDGVLKKDVTFGSPSAASDFICGTPTQGTVFWKDAQGVPIKDYMVKNGKTTQAHRSLSVAGKSATWKNPTQLAKAISAKFNGGKSKDHIRFLLVGERPVPPGSQYREPFESIGLAFGADNRVVDWHSARRW